MTSAFESKFNFTIILFTIISLFITAYIICPEGLTYFESLKLYSLIAFGLLVLYVSGQIYDEYFQVMNWTRNRQYLHFIKASLLFLPAIVILCSIFIDLKKFYLESDNVSNLVHNLSTRGNNAIFKPSAKIGSIKSIELNLEDENDIYPVSAVVSGKVIGRMYFENGEFINFSNCNIGIQLDKDISGECVDSSSKKWSIDLRY